MEAAMVTGVCTRASSSRQCPDLCRSRSYHPLAQRRRSLSLRVLSNPSLGPARRTPGRRLRLAPLFLVLCTLRALIKSPTLTLWANATRSLSLQLNSSRRCRWWPLGYSATLTNLGRAIGTLLVRWGFFSDISGTRRPCCGNPCHHSRRRQRRETLDDLSLGDVAATRFFDLYMLYLLWPGNACLLAWTLQRRGHSGYQTLLISGYVYVWRMSSPTSTFDCADVGMIFSFRQQAQQLYIS